MKMIFKLCISDTIECVKLDLNNYANLKVYRNMELIIS